MAKYVFIITAFVLMLPALCCAQEDILPPAIAAKIDAQPQQTEAYDTTAVVPVPNQNQPSAQPPQNAPAKDQHGIKFLTDGKEEAEEALPQGVVAVYIDIEEAFNKNPWTMQARKGIKLDLETKQLEFARIKEQVRELKLKQEELYMQLGYYKPFYEALDYIEADADNLYPKITRDELKSMLNILTFYSCDSRVESPANPPQKTQQIKDSIQDNAKDIREKENFLANFKALSREEILSRQDVIIQAVLKEIYSGIKEYAQMRNIGIVVDKSEIIYGKPLNITPEFVKWMKSYHKKYKEQYGDIL